MLPKVANHEAQQRSHPWETAAARPSGEQVVAAVEVLDLVAAAAVAAVHLRLESVRAKKERARTNKTRAWARRANKTTGRWG